MSHSPDDKNVRYFATQNLRSPFVAVFGDWSGRSALVRNSILSGVKLGKRPAIDCEISAMTASTRSMFMYWSSVREMLWTHRSPDLIHYYPGLVANLRKHWPEIRRVGKVVEKKRVAKQAEKATTARIVAQNKERQSCGNPV